MAQKKDDRVRNWVAIMYPESLPKNWESLLRDLKTDIVISPLHDKDIQPDGTKKKPHYHVVFRFDSKKSTNQVLEILKPFNCPRPEQVSSIKGQIRYLIHIDDPDKYQYQQSDIKVIGNVDIARYFQISQTDRYLLIKEMMAFISDNQITEISTLLDYAMESRFDDWFPLLTDNSAYIIDKYITSIRNQRKEQKERD